MDIFNGTKFKIVIDKALIPMGGRGLKESLKEALKGAKGAVPPIYLLESI